MPCENCSVQFSVFKRKKSCTECRRLFCNQCLIKRKEKVLCDRCVVFTKRPLSKIELLKLKPKDLIFYLQSKHISTTGCVEKEELVNLILAHINANLDYQDNYNETNLNNNNNQRHHNYGNSTSNNSSENCSNPFDQIKQTCQNLFHSFTEKIVTDISFDYFDLKPSTSSGQQSQQTFSPNIYSQPRSSTNTNINNQQQPPQKNQKIPNKNPSTTIHNLSNTTAISTSTSDGGNSSLFNLNIQPNNIIPSTSSSKNTMPDSSKNVIEPDKIPYKLQTNLNELPSEHNNKNAKKSNYKLLTNFNHIAACDCSDDESFKKIQSNYEEHCSRKNLPGPSGSHINNSNQDKKLNNSVSSESLSSFEELGAVGGSSSNGCSNRCSSINDGIADCNIPSTSCCKDGVNSASSDTENWQFINKTDDECKENNDKIADVVNDDDDDDDDDGYFDDKNMKMSDDKFVYNYYLSNHKTVASSEKCLNTLTKLHKKQKHSINDNDTTINHKNEFLNKLLIERNQRKLTRRLSDSYIIGKKQKKQKLRTFIDNNCNNKIGKKYVANTINDNDDDDNDGDNDDEQVTIIHCCNKCGKSKNNIKKHILKFRKQLETKTITELEKSKQLNEFLLYLEEKTKNSFDYSDESINEDLVTAETSNVAANITNLNDDQPIEHHHPTHPTTRITINNIDSEHYYEDDLILEDDVLHVNPINNIYDNVPKSLNKKESIRKYMKLNDISSSDQLENLSVKQLKEILILNRVDFKGCCEKNELLERAQRLWNDYVSCPSADKLPTDDLCKICMDAPIECVILECGHMATCTDCGKVLSECPICRQYIVRVVRFFRA